MMVSKTYIIYSAIDPRIKKEVSSVERKEFLKCKFWKNTSHEAWMFFYCYYPPSIAPNLSRILLVLSGRLFKAKNFHETMGIADDLSFKYATHKLKIDLVDDVQYKKIIAAFLDEQNRGLRSYPQNGLLEDIILWAKNKRLITGKQFNSLKIKIISIRGTTLDNQHLSDEVLRCTISTLLESEFGNPLLYDDAQALLFPQQDLLRQLIEINKQPHYFRIRSLMKWLMQKGYLSAQLTEAFKTIKIESIKENITPDAGRFSSLQKLIKHGADRDSLLCDALEGKPLYWHYPTDCKCRKDYDNRCICKDGVLWDKSIEWMEYPIIEKKRFKSFGRLNIMHNDGDRLGAFRGGLTVEMLRNRQLPETTLNCFRINLVPTQEEIDYGLQPYVKVSKNELMTVIADDRIGFLEGHFNIHQPEKQNPSVQQLSSTIIVNHTSEVNHFHQNNSYVASYSDLSVNSQTENHFTIQNECDKKSEDLDGNIGKNKSKTVHVKNKPNKINLLIQQYWIDLDSKDAESIWREMRKDRHNYTWIEENFPYWSDGRKASIIWGTPTKQNGSLCRAAFETYISKLGQGKIPICEHQYKFTYEDYQKNSQS